MNREAFDPGRFGISYDEFLLCYQTHIKDLFHAYTDKRYRKLTKFFALQKDDLLIPKSSRVDLDRALSRSRLIRLEGNKDPAVISARVFGNIAAGCNMLDSRAVPLTEFNDAGATNLARTILDSTIKSLGRFAHRNFIGDIHIADTVRVIRFLQLTGFMKLTRARTQQLSLGAYTGIRDLNAIHSIQSIQVVNGETKYIKFGSHLRQAAHTVLVDPEKDVASHYERLNSDPEANVLGLLLTADDAMELVAERIQQGLLEPRNLVVSMRIDHRMIPDSSEFLRLMAGTISETADLIMTFGAGDNPDQFIGRMNAFNKIEERLTELGMHPIRLRMHDDSSDVINDHRESPLYGLYHFASHEALYCKLIREKML